MTMTYSEAMAELRDLDFAESDLEKLMVQQGENPVVILAQYKADNPIDPLVQVDQG